MNFLSEPDEFGEEEEDLPSDNEDFYGGDSDAGDYSGDAGNDYVDENEHLDVDPTTDTDKLPGT